MKRLTAVLLAVMMIGLPLEMASGATRWRVKAVKRKVRGVQVISKKKISAARTVTKKKVTRRTATATRTALRKTAAKRLNLMKKIAARRRAAAARK